MGAGSAAGSVVATAAGLVAETVAGLVADSVAETAVALAGHIRSIAYSTDV